MEKYVTVKCCFCQKDFVRPLPEDETLQFLVFEHRQFCSDNCMLAELERECKATDAFNALGSSDTVN